MDRDVALQLLTNLTAVNTAVQKITTNTTPAAPSAALNMSRLESAVDPEEEPEFTEEPKEPEVIPEEPKSKK